tara:strand:- start:87 stop:575 length:489 start_codon:yes stop_codon:yes gene_type:complete
MNRLIIFFFFLIFSSFLEHKYYVSTSLFNFSEDSSLQITLRIFKDDLSNAISDTYLDQKTDDLNLIDELYFKQVDKYINSKISILIDDKKFEMDYLGLETKNDMYVCYLEIENLPIYTNMVISNKILFEIFDDQQNIIHVKRNDKRQSFIARNNNSFLTLDI